MVNCIYVGGQNNEEFDNFITIINEKYNPGKDCLIEIQDRVLESYELYINSFEDLQNLQGSKFTNLELDEKRHLQNCYSSHTYTFKILRGEIFDSQTKQIKAFCPYCLLNKPTTLDHYIGQTEFPEYSILIKNLIPCCYDCNQKKDENWRMGNRRRFIHFYNDNFLNSRFLYANLIFNDNDDVPLIEFQLLNSGHLIEYQFEIISWHFEDLDLINEYVQRSNAMLSTEIEIIKKSYQRGDSIEYIKQVVIDKFVNTLGFGANYWQNCLYEAISNNIENIININ